MATVLGATAQRSHSGDENEYHYQRLKDFQPLPKPISAAEIKKTVCKT